VTPFALIGGLCLATVCAAGMGSKRRSKSAAAGYRVPPSRRTRRRRPVRCLPLPWLDDEVKHAIHTALLSGQDDAGVVADYVLRTVYPTALDGQPIAWPCVPGDSACLHQLERDVVRECVSCLTTRVRG